MAVYRHTLSGLLLAILCITGLLSPAVFPQSRDAERRPLNSFNLRYLRLSFSTPTARPLSMGGAAIALSDDPTAATINPAGLVFYVRPAISPSTKLSVREFSEPAVVTGSDDMEVRHTDLFFDEALLSAVVQYKRLHLSTFREVIYDARLSFQSLQTIEVDPALPVETVIQRNFPSRKTLLKTRIVDNGLSLAWGFSERLNFGASLRLTRLEYHLNEEQYYENEFPGPALQYRGLNHITADNLYLLQSIDEKRWGIGFSAGMISHLSERLMVGLVYNYRPAFDLKSNIFLPRYSVSRGDSLITFASREDTTTRVRYDLPDAYGIGIAYKYRGRLNIALDLVRVRYSELLSPAEKSRSGRDPRNLIQDDLPGGIDPEKQNDLVLEDGWEFHAGVEYILKVGARKLRLPLRIGYYYDPGHIAHAREGQAAFQPLFPEEKGYHHATAGLGFFWGEKLRLDGAMDLTPKAITLVGTTIYVF